MKVRLNWLLALAVLIMVSVSNLQGQEPNQVDPVVSIHTEPALGNGASGEYSSLRLLPGEKWQLLHWIEVEGGLTDTSVPCIVALGYKTNYYPLTYFKEWGFRPLPLLWDPFSNGTWQHSDSDWVYSFSYLADGKIGISGNFILSQIEGVNGKASSYQAGWAFDLIAVVFDDPYLRERRFQCQVNFWGIDGIRGDINGDSCVSIDDIQLYREYLSAGLDCSYIWGYFFKDRFGGGETNYGRGIVLFNSPNWVDLWLINLWLNNPADPVVQNLGIGQLMSMELTEAGPIPVPITSTLTGNELKIKVDNPEISTAVNITASLPEGKFWQKTEFMENGELIIRVPDVTAKYDIEAVKMNSGLTSALKEEGKKPLGFILGQNYPNPFNANTTISYFLPQDGRIEIVIYDLRGQKVRTLVKDSYRAGNHFVYWNGKNEYGEEAPSGIYFYRLISGSTSICKKLLFQK